MERIRKALELAKAEREQARRQGGDPTAEPAPPSAESAAAEPAAAAWPQARGRSVAVNLDHLREAHLLLPGLQGPAAHSFETLRMQVVQRMAQRGWSTLAVVGPGRDAGKTFTAVNLAIAIAADPDARVLLVDLDLHSPSLHRRFGFEPTWGVDDCLRGRATLSVALVRPEGYPRLRVLPVRSPVEQPSELLASAGARELFAALRPREPGQYAIYDLPPLPGNDDALALSPQVDAALVVIGDGRTRRDDLQHCVERLRGIPVLGSVLNGAADGNVAAAAAV